MAEVTSYTLSGPASSPSSRYHKYSTLRADSALTTSYVASSHIDLLDIRKVNLLLTLTWVDSTSLEYYVEWSHDASNWFRSINVSTSSGVNTITANNQTFAASASAKLVDSFDKQARYMRVNVKKTGGVGADSLEVIAEGAIY